MFGVAPSQLWLSELPSASGRGVLSVGNIEIHNSVFSDHTPIVSTLTITCVIFSTCSSVCQVRNLNTRHFERFKALFSDITCTFQGPYSHHDFS